jgi:ABC-type dipeptide/oligopeptide/nickel transport system permease component
VLRWTLPALAGIAVWSSVLVVSLGLLADIAAVLLDPRIDLHDAGGR